MGRDYGKEALIIKWIGYFIIVFHKGEEDADRYSGRYEDSSRIYKKI